MSDHETNPMLDKHDQSKGRVLNLLKCWVCMSVFGAIICLLGFFCAGKYQCGTSTAPSDSCLDEAHVKAAKCFFLTYVVVSLVAVMILRKMYHHLLEDDQWADARKTLWCYLGLCVASILYAYWQTAKRHQGKACRNAVCDTVFTVLFTWYVHRYTKEVEQRNC